MEYRKRGIAGSMLFLKFPRNGIFEKQEAEMIDREQEKKIEEVKKLLAIRVFWDGKNDSGFIEHFPQFTYAIDHDRRILLVCEHGEVQYKLFHGWSMMWCKCEGELRHPSHVVILGPDDSEE